jgi:hypothetical protein
LRRRSLDGRWRHQQGLPRAYPRDFDGREKVGHHGNDGRRCTRRSPTRRDSHITGFDPKGGGCATHGRPETARLEAHADLVDRSAGTDEARRSVLDFAGRGMGCGQGQQERHHGREAG